MHITRVYIILQSDIGHYQQSGVQELCKRWHIEENVFKQKSHYSHLQRHAIFVTEMCVVVLLFWLYNFKWTMHAVSVN